MQFAISKWLLRYSALLRGFQAEVFMSPILGSYFREKYYRTSETIAEKA